MKSYTVLFAEDVPHYGSVTVVAENDASALAHAKAFWRDAKARPTVDPDWSGSVCHRIVHIEDESGRVVAVDVALDDFVLERRGCRE